ncbi:DUF6252 family protein [Phaeodactylibacter xiamenensis]|uniref:DUF6252 family protein n=1 Tax=Phaeodactylibacter xiamenensis TaxID=1524460 RepID=UPI0024A8FFCF|nr:DUF6252 family protein [Phaeodactylibacter xiamenensis]
MKYIFPMLLLAMLFTQCRDDVPTLNPDGSMKAAIDGSSWQADVLEAAYVDGELTLSGSTLDERAIVMGATIGDLQPQTVAFLPGSPDGLTYTSVGGARTYVSNTAGGDGFLRITAVDTAREWISGRFEARCYRLQEGGGVEITEGVFTKVPYTDTLPPIFSSGVRAVIDGATWTSDSVATALSDGQIRVQSLGENGRQIRFRIPENADHGTYDLDPTGAFSAIFITMQSDTLSAESGTISIDLLNEDRRRLEGTFNFEATGSQQVVSLADGRFEINY